MASALILDGNLKSALCTVRALGRQGIPVVCGASRKYGMSLFSKYVTGRFVYPSPTVAQDAFLDSLITAAQKCIAHDGEKPILYCFSDATFTTVVDNYSLLQDYVAIALPSYESFAIASDKKRTYELAQTLSMLTIPEFSQYDLEKVSYPAVVKNRHSVVFRNGTAVSGSASFVFNKDELEKKITKVSNETGEIPLIQAFIVGEEYGVEMVCKDGRPLATFIHKRIRSLSPRGGAAVVKETAADTRETKLMRVSALALAQTLHWQGPIMVEFKVSKENGKVYLMEINGRFWGSLPLPVRAGIDFPLLFYKLSHGVEITQPVEQASVPHVRTRHFLGDCKWLLGVLFRHDSLRELLYPSRLRALYDFKKEMFISRGDVFSVHDMKPSFMEYLDQVGSILNRK